MNTRKQFNDDYYFGRVSSAEYKDGRICQECIHKKGWDCGEMLNQKVDDTTLRKAHVFYFGCVQWEQI